MAELGGGHQQAGVALLALCSPAVVVAFVVFLRHRRRHPIVDRSPAIVLAVTALTLAAVLLLLLPLVLASQSAPLCGLSLLALSLTLIPVPLLLLLRSLVFVFRLEWGGALERCLALRRKEERPQKGGALRSGGSDVESEDGEQSSQRSSGDGAELEARRESTGGAKGEEETAVGVWWIDQRLLLGARLLSVGGAAVAALSVAGLLLPLLLDRSDAVAVSSPPCPLRSPPYVAARVVGLCLLVLNSALLCLSSFRHPSAYGLRAEAVVTTAAVLTALPLSFALSLFDSLAASSWYAFLAFQLLLLSASTAVPLVYAYRHSLHSSHLAELSSIRSFHDLIRNALGFDSFHAFVQTEFSEENLTFWKEVETLRLKADVLEAVEAELAQRRDKEREQEKALKEEEERQTAFQAAAQTRNSASLARVAPPSPPSSAPLEPHSPRSQPRRIPRPDGVDEGTTSSLPPLPNSSALTPLYVAVHQPGASSQLHPRGGPSIPSLQSVVEGRRRRNTSAGELSHSPVKHKRDGSQPTSGESAGHQLIAGARSSDCLRIPTGSPCAHKRHRSSGSSGDDVVAFTAANPPNFPPFPFDGSWDVDAIDKLRRVSWSIALDKKAQRRRESSQSALQSQAEQRRATSANPESPRQGTGSPRPATSGLAYSSSQPITVSVPAVREGGKSAKTSPRALVAPSPAAVVPPMTPSPKVATPFMQSIVRALQATKLTSAAKWVEKEEEMTKRLMERQAALHLELLRAACDIVDRHILPGSVAQVNLPDALVQRVMERMREVNPVKYAAKAKQKARGGHGVHSMQHTLGLMRHATIQFFGQPGLSKAKVSPFTDRQRVLAAEAERRTAQEAAAQCQSLGQLSFPIVDLFADAQDAIQQLMEKDSFKRYLASPAFEDFISTYAQRRGVGSAWGQPVLSRHGSRSRLALQTPRALTSRERGEEGGGGAHTGRRTSASSRIPTSLHPLHRGSQSINPESHPGRSSLASSQLSPRTLALPQSSSSASHPPSPTIQPTGAPTLSPASSHSHPVWPELRKFPLPIATTRSSSISTALTQHLNRTRPSSSNGEVGGGAAVDASPKRSPQRALAMGGEVGGPPLSPRTTRRRLSSLSIAAEGILEESEDGIEDVS